MRIISSRSKEVQFEADAVTFLSPSPCPSPLALPTPTLFSPTSRPPTANLRLHFLSSQRCCILDQPNYPARVNGLMQFLSTLEKAAFLSVASLHHNYKLISFVAWCLSFANHIVPIMIKPFCASFSSTFITLLSSVLCALILFLATAGKPLLEDP